MSKKNTILSLITLLAMLLVVLTACTSEEVPAGEELEETDKLVIYSPNSENLLNSTIPLFEESMALKWK